MSVQLAEILLIEDDLGDILLTQEACKSAKLANKIYVARDGIEALDFLKRVNGNESAPRPDLILLDLNMPRMNGHEFLKEIKANPEFSAIPVVVLTTSEDEKDVLATYQLHANCYITKPVSLEGMKKIVSAIDEFWIGLVRLPHKT